MVWLSLRPLSSAQLCPPNSCSPAGVLLRLNIVKTASTLSVSSPLIGRHQRAAASHWLISSTVAGRMLQGEAASELETDIIHTSAHHVVEKLIIFNIFH